MELDEILDMQCPLIVDTGAFSLRTSNQCLGDSLRTARIPSDVNKEEVRQESAFIRRWTSLFISRGNIFSVLPVARELRGYYLKVGHAIENIFDSNGNPKLLINNESDLIYSADLFFWMNNLHSSLNDLVSLIPKTDITKTFLQADNKRFGDYLSLVSQICNHRPLEKSYGYRYKNHSTQNKKVPSNTDRVIFSAALAASLTRGVNILTTDSDIGRMANFFARYVRGNQNYNVPVGNVFVYSNFGNGKKWHKTSDTLSGIVYNTKI